jgi:hypothetical protein
VLCKCSHLTSFAVIGETTDVQRMRPSDGDNYDRFVLHLIAFIGSFIAVLALGITLITYLCIK